MPRLPARFAAVILCFAPLFRQRSWRRAEVLLIGAILAPGRRTVIRQLPDSTAQRLVRWGTFAFVVAVVAAMLAGALSLP